MKTWQMSLEGIVPLLIGAVSSAGIFILARPNEYRAVVRIKVHQGSDLNSFKPNLK